MIGITSSIINNSGGSEPVLLWTNPNPTTGFVSQTIAIDLTEYDYFQIKYRRSTGSPNEYVYSEIIPTSGDSAVYGMTSTYGFWREIKSKTNTSLTFGTGYNVGSADNKICAPLEIYGIKSVPIAKETEIVYNYNQGNLQQNITDTFTYTATNKARLFVDCLAGAHGAELDGCSNVSDGTLNGTVVTPLYTFDDSPQYGRHHCKIFEVSMEIGDVFQVSVTSNWSSNSKVNGRVYAHILAIRENI